MVKYLAILFILISAQGFSQVREINVEDFKKLRLNKPFIHHSNGDFFYSTIRGHISYMQNRFKTIELDTLTYKLHIVGQVYDNNNPDYNEESDINIGELVSEDSKGAKMKFTHYFSTDKKGNYDISFVINNKNSLLTFNSTKRDDGTIIIQISDIYRVGNLLK